MRGNNRKENSKLSNNNVQKRKPTWINSTKRSAKTWNSIYRTWRRSLMTGVTSTKSNSMLLKIIMKLWRHLRRLMQKSWPCMSKSTTKSIMTCFRPNLTVKILWRNNLKKRSNNLIIIGNLKHSKWSKKLVKLKKWPPSKFSKTRKKKWTDNFRF